MSAPSRTDAVIVDAVRTPVGKGKPTGALHDVHPVDLLAHSLRGLVERAGLDPAVVDDVVVGNVTEVDEQGQNVARTAVLAAGFPESVPATTVNRQCGSSQQAIAFAAQGVAAGAYDVVIAAGVESMSRVPMLSDVRPGADPFGPAVAHRYPAGFIPQGYSAELIAARWGLSRTQLDEFALASHAKGAAAAADGRFDRELLPVAGLDHDEMVRPGGSLDTLGSLRSAFYDEAMARRFPEIRWHISAGNSSPLSDGSAAVLIMSAEAAAKYGLTPRARVHTATAVGSDPILMLTGIIPATHRVLDRAGLRLDEIDLFEVNEAFSPVVLAWAAETGADLGRTNVNGGAIALGHPLGASGARIMSTLVNALEQTGGRYGLQLMCEAGGQANATVVERLG